MLASALPRRTERPPLAGALMLGVALVLTGAGATRAVAQEAQQDDAGERALRAIGRLEARLGSLENAQAESREERSALVRELRDVRALLESRTGPGPAAAFVVAPPASSDAVAAARSVVFAPKLEVLAARRHDTVFLRLRRVEQEGVVALGDLELAQTESRLDVPIDRSGGLYVLDWATAEGYAFQLELKDGASGRTAAVVEVKPEEAKGRFLFVGLRLE
ncbi:MAG: hypothetical protein AB7O37_03695 [Vicinamibacteria bacterium]